MWLITLDLLEIQESSFHLWLINYDKRMVEMFSMRRTRKVMVKEKRMFMNFDKDMGSDMENLQFLIHFGTPGKQVSW